MANKKNTIKLEPNAHGARKITVKSWKGIRLYLKYHYSTKYNRKRKDLGWIACNGEDWDLSLNYVPDDVRDAVDTLKQDIVGA